MTAMIAAAIELLASTMTIPLDRNHFFLPLDRTPTLVESIVDAKLNACLESDTSLGSYDQLVLGDSSGLMGVDPILLQEECGQTTYNLCTISLIGVEGHLAMLKRFARSRGIPKALIYHFAPHELRFSDKDLVAWKFRRQTFRWLADADGQLPAAMEFSDGEYILPSQKFRSTAQLLLSPPVDLSGRLDQPRQAWPSHNQVLRELTKRRGLLTEISTFQNTSPMELRLSLSKHHEQMLCDLFEYCDEHQVQVFVVSNPLPEIAKTAVTTKALQVIEAEMERLTRQFDNVTFLFGSTRFYSDASFATLNHLHPSAIPRNTHEIAAAIRKATADTQ